MYLNAASCFSGGLVGEDRQAGAAGAAAERRPLRQERGADLELGSCLRMASDAAGGGHHRRGESIVEVAVRSVRIL